MKVWKGFETNTEKDAVPLYKEGNFLNLFGRKYYKDPKQEIWYERSLLLAFRTWILYDLLSTYPQWVYSIEKWAGLGSENRQIYEIRVMKLLGKRYILK